MDSFKRKSCGRQMDKKPTIEQTLELYVDNALLSDVCFLVADKKIRAHRLILAMSNWEFKRLLYDTDAERSDQERPREILVLDCSYSGLFNVIRLACGQLVGSSTSGSLSNRCLNNLESLHTGISTRRRCQSNCPKSVRPFWPPRNTKSLC